MGKWIGLLLALLLADCPAMALRADANGDGRVDATDLAILAEEWLMSEPRHQLVSSGGGWQGFTIPADPAFNFNGTNFSMSFWGSMAFVPNSFTLNKTNSFYVGCTDSGDFIGLLRFSFGGVSIMTAGGHDLVGKPGWWCVVGDRSGYLSVYFNNVLVGQADFTAAGNFDSESEVFQSKHFGAFDDFRVYKKALSSSERAAIYNGGRGTRYTAAVEEGGTAAVVFEFDEGEGLESASTVITTEAELTLTLTADDMWRVGGVPFSAGASAGLLSVRTAAGNTRTACGDGRTLLN